MISFFLREALYEAWNKCKQAYDLDLSTIKAKTNLRTEPKSSQYIPYVDIRGENLLPGNLNVSCSLYNDLMHKN